ncbi:MAG: glycosyltransferase [Candidatus Aenigmarchaeota archaeon]|nr:glycosyltransferase [Candidatus Aenigmarchaeota archaeon]
MRILVSYSKIPASLGDYCVNALRRLGYEVFTHDYLGAAHTLGLPGHAINKVVLKERLPNSQILAMAKRLAPDVVLIMKGEVFEPRTIQTLKEHAKVANWCMDSPFHEKYSSQKVVKSIGLYDCFFTPVSDMKRRLQSFGFDNARFLPFACDPEMHKSVTLSKEEKFSLGSDVCFVGTYYPEREILLSGLEKFGLKIWGNEWQRCADENVKKCATLRAANGMVMTKVFNASRIAIGTHQEQSMGSPTMRVFEAPACGTFMLTDWRTDLPLFFSSGEMASYRTKRELLEKTEYYLTHEKERKAMARRAQRKAQKKHTYDIRMKQMIKELE